jgi:hypothetical protein
MKKNKQHENFCKTTDAYMYMNGEKYNLFV